jgi:DNA-binding response OmpR family regulator
VGKTILIVEDDSSIRRGVADALQFHGYQTLEAKDGIAGLDSAIKAEFDLLLLDLVLPGRDGLSLLQELRRVRPSIPVIIVTARGEEPERVRGLQLGADDYVVKPYSVKELLARVQAVLRRSAERPADISRIPFPGGSADLARCEIRLDNGQRHELSQREADVLRYLGANNNRVISRDELLQRVWRISGGGAETRTIDMHIARLREKLGDTAQPPEIILTVRGKGYMFSTPGGGQP